MLNDQGLPQRRGLDNYLQRNKVCIDLSIDTNVGAMTDYDFKIIFCRSEWVGDIWCFVYPGGHKTALITLISM